LHIVCNALSGGSVFKVLFNHIFLFVLISFDLKPMWVWDLVSKWISSPAMHLNIDRYKYCLTDPDVLFLNFLSDVKFLMKFYMHDIA